MLHEEHDPLCLFQDSYQGSNIQYLNKTRMHLLLQALAMVTAYFSRVEWTVQMQRLALVHPIRPCLASVLATHCSVPAFSRKVKAEPNKNYYFIPLVAPTGNVKT